MSTDGRRRWLLAGAAVLSGCAFDVDADHDGPDAPEAVPLSRPVRTAWVFSSGGPRGFVHVGVLKGLQQLGLRPDVVVGASVGAVVGALYASGLPASRIEALALELQPTWLARLAVGASERFSGTALREWLDGQLAVQRLQDLPLPLVAVAQRVGDGSVVGFTRGSVALAAQAAAAVEGQFAPVRIRGRRYADADRRMPLPVRLARRLGAARVLAVDASAHEDRAPPGAERWRDGDLHKRELTRPDAERADVLLHPDFGYWVNLSRDFRERAIAAGHQAVLAAEPALRALHGA